MCKFDVLKFGEYIARYKPQRFWGLPHVIRTLTETKFEPNVFDTIAQMDTVIIGGAPLPKSLEDSFDAKIDAASKGHRKVAIDQVWGMTEVGFV